MEIIKNENYHQFNVNKFSIDFFFSSVFSFLFRFPFSSSFSALRLCVCVLFWNWSKNLQSDCCSQHFHCTSFSLSFIGLLCSVCEVWTLHFSMWIANAMYVFQCTDFTLYSFTVYTDVLSKIEIFLHPFKAGPVCHVFFCRR